MSAIIANIRDEICREITAQMSGTAPALSPTLPVLAAYDPESDLDGLTGGRVIVVPRQKTCEPLTRGGPHRRDVAIDVAVQFKGETGTTTLDPYLALAETIADYFERRTLDMGATCIKVEHSALWVDSHLVKFSTLTSVVTLTFTLNK